MRKFARETAFKLIFEYLFLKEQNETSIKELCSAPELSDEDRDYINAVYNGVIGKYDEIYGEIAGLSSDFKAERIYKVDLAILLLAIYEIDYMEDVPDIVAVNEAVETAKVYSTDKSHLFINGILASYLSNKKNAGKAAGQTKAAEEANGADN